MYAKLTIVVDDDANAYDWREIIWAVTTRMDPVCDIILIEDAPIDYLNFANPVSGPGEKMSLDVTNKQPGETNRKWGHVIRKDPAVTTRIDETREHLGLQMSLLLGFIL